MGKTKKKCEKQLCFTIHSFCLFIFFEEMQSLNSSMDMKSIFAALNDNKNENKQKSLVESTECVIIKNKCENINILWTKYFNDPFFVV